MLTAKHQIFDLDIWPQYLTLAQPLILTDRQKGTNQSFMSLLHGCFKESEAEWNRQYSVLPWHTWLFHNDITQCQILMSEWWCYDITVWGLLGKNTVKKGTTLRRFHFRWRRLANDAAFTLAAVGFLLMLVEKELHLYDVVERSDTASILIKSCITVTTLVLVVCVLLYHNLDINLYIFDRSIKVC